MKVLITGISGFIGQALAKKLLSLSTYDVTGTTRSLANRNNNSENIRYVNISDITSTTNWNDALTDIDIVVHLAARAHILKHDPDAESKFRAVNFDGALNLAQQALEAKVKRFIFISSIGVNGSYTVHAPFDEQSTPSPTTAYGISKYDAEQALHHLVEKNRGMELVIIRPPLVYAAHAPGNFQRLLKLVASGIPLPFGLIKNQRSIIALENLIDFIILCTHHPAAANELFLISDTGDVSTVDIAKHVAEGMGKKSVLLPVPVVLIRAGVSLIGKQALYSQLCESLTIDCTKALNLLDWKPVTNSQTALQEAGRTYKSSSR